MISSTFHIKGRGVSENPANRFDKIEYIPDEEDRPEETIAPQTEFYRDQSKSLITYNSSPDVYFDASINPYRGCEHGCIYCYARPNHEYFGLSSGLDFDTKIFVKTSAPHLLGRELNSPKWKPQSLALSGVTDPYQPIEKKLGLTRRCLAVLRDFRNPVQIITKSERVTRDLDILKNMAEFEGIQVLLTVTTLDSALSRIMEPRASQPHRRLAALRKLADAGIPCGILIAPVIPGLTDHEIPRILQSAASAGGRYAGYIMLRLPHGIKEIFHNWLSLHFPDKRQKILSRIRQIREGKLYDSNYYIRMKGQGQFAGQIEQMFKISAKKFGLNTERPVLSIRHFRRHSEKQLALF